MVFGKKKEDMIDLSQIKKRSINLPHGKDFVAKDGQGFVDFTKKSRNIGETKKVSNVKVQETASASSTFSFFDSSPSFTQSTNSSSSSSDQETKDLLRRLSTQISDLDSKIYQLEQRMELVEKKIGVGSSSSIGW